MTTLGVDFSEYGGALSPSTVDCWKQKGIGFAIPQYSHRLPGHLRVVTESGGLELGIYVYLFWGVSPWGQTPMQRVMAALQMCEGYPVKRVWLDCEDTTHPYQERQLQECVDLAESRGMPQGIYTAPWWWIPQTGNSQKFSYLPLWHAGYVKENPYTDLTLRAPWDSFEPYGGWTRPLIWQIQNTSTLCGHSVDLNEMEDVPVNESDQLDLTILRSNERLIRALTSKPGLLVCIPGPTADTIEVHRVVDGQGFPFSPPVILPVGVQP